MHANACLIYLLALFSFVNVYAIPIQTTRSSPSEKIMKKLSRFVMRQPPKPSTSVVASSVHTTPSPASTHTSIAQTSSSSPLKAVTASSSNPSTPSSTTTGSVAQPSQPPAATNGSQKYVVAHHMVGNTFPYTLEDWKEDIALAHASGIDGFALNTGSDSWEPDRIADAYTAAEQSGLDFKLFFSLDMSSLPCTSPDDATTLRNLVSKYISHPSQLQIASQAFVSTFSGETCTFGQGSVSDGWSSQFSNHPDLSGKITFVPAFFVDPSTFSKFADVIHGAFNWNSGWPIELTTSFAQQIVNNSTSSNPTQPHTLLDFVTHSTAVAAAETTLNAQVNSTLNKLQLALSQFIGATQTDTQYLDSLAALPNTTLQARDGQPTTKPIYMAAVSPWFFTHYGPKSFNKNFIYLSDQHLYSKRWESIINLRDQFDIVQIPTWNDYGESDYIGPIKGAQPDSQSWTDGMDHTGWLELTQYYSAAFKTGQYPTIEKDKIIMWSRTHSTSATAPDPVPPPTNFQLFEDNIWAVVMTTAPSNVTLTTSPTTSQTFSVPAGLSKLSLPIFPGGTMKGTIERGGQTIVELNPSNFTFRANPPTYNFNAFVANATAD